MALPSLSGISKGDARQHACVDPSATHEETWLDPALTEQSHLLQTHLVSRIVQVDQHRSEVHMLYLGSLFLDGLQRNVKPLDLEKQLLTK